MSIWQILIAFSLVAIKGGSGFLAYRMAKRRGMTAPLWAMFGFFIIIIPQLILLCISKKD